MLNRVNFTINGTGLHFDRNYGVESRTGWSGLRRGRVVVQFVSLWRALLAVLKRPPQQ